MAQKKIVYVTRRIPQPGIDILNDKYDMRTWDSDEAIPKDKLIANIRGIDALLCMLTDPIDKEVLAAAGGNLKVVSTMSVGYEHIDLQECKDRKIVVCNTPNVSTDSVAELTCTLLLFVARRLGEGLEAVKKGSFSVWKPTFMCGIGLTNKVLGVYGLGRIGFSVASRLKPFGVKQIIYSDVVEVSYASDIDAQFREFDALLAEADFLCICCNLTPQTKHKFNAAAFQKMKKTAVLVNTGRGGVIDHDALYEALKAGVIAAAGLDVTEPEPLPKDHRLISLKNCIVAPHMGSNTWDTRNLMAETAASNIVSVFSGNHALGEVKI